MQLIRQPEHFSVCFRYCFPFGRPEGALKATLSLLERVRMEVKDRWHVRRDMNIIVVVEWPSFSFLEDFFFYLSSNIRINMRKLPASQIVKIYWWYAPNLSMNHGQALTAQLCTGIFYFDSNRGAWSILSCNEAFTINFKLNYLSING